MIFRFMVDQLQNHSGLFKKVPPISLYPQQIPAVAEKGNMKLALSLALCLAFAFVVKSSREEDLSLFEDDFVRDKVENNKRFLFKKRVSTLCEQSSTG